MESTSIEKRPDSEHLSRATDTQGKESHLIETDPDIDDNSTSMQTKGKESHLIEKNPDIEDSSTSMQTQGSRLQRLRKWLFPTGYLIEFKSIVYLAWSLYLTELFQFLFSTVAIAFCGRLGKIELDGVAMATSLINVTGLSVMVGLSSACDTLFSQLYGSPHKDRIGVALQRSIMIMMLCLFPCWAIHLNAEAFLVLIGQDAEVARLAGNYLLIFMPGLLSYCIYVPLTKYLQNQNIVIPNLVIGFIANLVNALAHYIFVYVLDMGTDGSAVAQVLGYFTILVLTLLYISISKVYVGTWSGLSKDSFQAWGSFGSLSIFGLMMICIEWWSFEISIFMAGLLGTTELGAQSIIFQLSSIFYMIPLGMGMATSIRVGQFLGAGQALHAKNATRVAFSITWTIAFGMLIVLISLGSYVPAVFTNVEEVQDLVTSVIPALASYLVFDCSNGVGNGILRGMGRQKLGTVFNAFAFGGGLATGIPAMLLSGLGILGYWWCMFVAICLETCFLLTFILRCDWYKEVEKAQSRVKHEKLEEEEDWNSEPNENATEKTALLGSPKDPADTAARPLSRRVILNRVLLILFVSAILAVGITTRLLVPIPESTADSCAENSTSIIFPNGTVVCN